MTSQRQILANRANALKSTGPITDDGKAKSRYNALRHGLTAREVVIPGEDPTEYESLLERAISEIQPDCVFSESLTDRFVSTLWRLRRIPKLEQAFFAWSQHKRHWEDIPPLLDTLDNEEVGHTSNPSILPREQASRRQQASDDFTGNLWKELKNDEIAMLKLMGRAVEDACKDANVLTKLSGYERKLLRQLDQTIAQWRSCKKFVRG